MDWTEISVVVKTADTALAEGICSVICSGMYTEDYSDLEQQAWDIAHIDLIDEELINKDRTTSVIHLYIPKEQNVRECIQALGNLLESAGIAYEIKTDTLHESDWADNWKKYFKVTPIGSRLVICPSWEKYDNKDSKAILKIDPGAAFGTGTHATTSLCLELLEKYVKKGDTMLDIGCGSGILSVAGVLLGADSAVGVDIDPTAVKVAKENALLNAVSDKTDFEVGDLAEKVNGKFDIICANIVADVIIRLNGDVKKYMTDDTIYITSGIIDVRAQQVKESFINSGFEIIEELKRDNWYAFALKSENKGRENTDA